MPSLDDAVDLPEPPSLDDARAVAQWRDAVVRTSYERGERLRQEGREEGEAAGRRRERARAIVDVLRRRGIAVSDDEAATISACRDAAKLDEWWEAAWTAKEASELFG